MAAFEAEKIRLGHLLLASARLLACSGRAASFLPQAVIAGVCIKICTLWFQLEDTFQLIVTPQGMELVMVHIEVISQCLKKYRVEYKACYIFLLDTIQL